MQTILLEHPRDIYFMHLAQSAATAAHAAGEIPIGAVLVLGDKVISRGFNHRIGKYDPSAHAEMNALRAGAWYLKNYRMPECELYVTLEPCLMCAGAIIHSRIARVVFGASNPKTGACGSVLNVFDNNQINHCTVLVRGVLADECGAILKAFFMERRQIARVAKKTINA
ncbi:MAG: tRNA adenosine(34) deaminase TadA [Burkholderia sp.]|nr:tRNA adenosine(34) deaminase TadA [Burkholderia sp.]